MATDSRPPSGPDTFLTRLAGAVNAHDLDGLVDCFAEDYVNETPVHPSRGFRGREQVRRNWTQIFQAVPDLALSVSRHTVDGDTVWAELDMRGTRRDGAAHHLAGVSIFQVAADGRADAIRFYLEPVDSDGLTADEAVRALTSPR